MASPQRRETVRHIQAAMAAGYSGMGAWCLFHPSSVISLALTPTYAAFDPTTSLFCRCFGAQAMTCGLLLGTSDMTVNSFVAFGLAMIPYIGFNAWFGIGPGKGVFTRWLWMDFIGNMVFGLGSMYCAKLLVEEEVDCKGKVS
ncbi:hypothetical protein QBC33DRAFT_549014 [Phialemonium atrogriseum]|uniref:Uncharacterized protein n=1 Tax=Phialemonium atrogriseum TaxID=1093897 RepID=A0AAJ0BVB7_9PEZI|nr:uncharacterized protein QBC33DRAFT_549014 [Phialemonium atrogriseum]KAK1763717.1 hypothetical protein QBC33DRAFT_549014 [Phialemonium atrogriseum]